ncbi:hypothetical protein GCM10007036_25010 [Alsobacter metallidurans]|uniref:Uncharacterized protein n=1 Tax=Alsobacter metallidurans TaxID=340221 RepID=A0A917I8F5_9HYPH|nr:hypothetical protein [Alsobacter metallidurans]GGH21029.1 hypothetical protein GCM10007036_25010 [Alsobacter metallidurans]
MMALTREARTLPVLASSAATKQSTGTSLHPSTVIPGLVPGIHALGSGVDGRGKPGHDGEEPGQQIHKGLRA